MPVHLEHDQLTQLQQLAEKLATDLSSFDEDDFMGLQGIIDSLDEDLDNEELHTAISIFISLSESADMQRLAQAASSVINELLVSHSETVSMFEDYPDGESDLDAPWTHEEAAEELARLILANDLDGVIDIMDLDDEEGDPLLSSMTRFESGITALGLAFITPGAEAIVSHLLGYPLESIDEPLIECGDIDDKSPEAALVDHGIMSFVLAIQDKNPELARIIAEMLLEQHQEHLEQTDIDQLEPMLLTKEEKEQRERLRARKELVRHMKSFPVMTYWPQNHELNIWLHQAFFAKALGQGMVILPIATPELLEADWLQRVAQGTAGTVMFHTEYSQDGEKLQGIELSTPCRFIFVPLNVNANHYTGLLLRYSETHKLEHITYIEPKPGTPFIALNFKQRIAPCLHQHFPGVPAIAINLAQNEDIFCGDYIYAVINALTEHGDLREDPRPLHGTYLHFKSRFNARSKLCATLGIEFTVLQTQCTEEQFTQLSTNHDPVELVAAPPKVREAIQYKVKYESAQLHQKYVQQQQMAYLLLQQQARTKATLGAGGAAATGPTNEEAKDDRTQSPQ